MNITVLIPTYRRIYDLSRCLAGLKQQTRSADQVIVVIRDTDAETWSFLQTFDRDTLPLQLAKVGAAGQVAALNAGLDLATGDIIAISDDDAIPQPEWLAQIATYFLSNAQIGGVGGRDWVHHKGQRVDETRQVVGRVQWLGRLVGNHHLGTGQPRPVEFLKGANMSYRRSAIANLRFDSRLRGTGAQVHNDLAFSLAVGRSGWTLIYDPLVAVDHYPAQRFDQDQRERFDRLALLNKVHNETLILLNHLPPARRIVFLIWGITVGTRSYRGLIQCLRFLPQEGLLSVQKLFAALSGRWQGWRTWKEVVSKVPEENTVQPVKVQERINLSGRTAWNDKPKSI